MCCKVCERALPLALPAGGGARPQTPCKECWSSRNVRCHADQHDLITWMCHCKECALYTNVHYYAHRHDPIALVCHQHLFAEGVWATTIGLRSPLLPQRESGRG